MNLPTKTNAADPYATPLLLPRERRKRGGFTLVEVVLALGIIAVAFIPVLGLLPVGLDVARQAIDATVEAQIVQQMANQAQQTDFSKLPALSGTVTYYFDYQGNETDQANAVYSSSFSVSATTSLPSGISRDNLAKVTIGILNITSRRTSEVPDLTENPDARKFVVLIPDNGR